MPERQARDVSALTDSLLSDINKWIKTKKLFIPPIKHKL